MALIARVIGVSLLTGCLGVGLGFLFFGMYREWGGISIVFASAGGIIGAIAGAAREIVTARGYGPSTQGEDQSGRDDS